MPAITTPGAAKTSAGVLRSTPQLLPRMISGQSASKPYMVTEPAYQLESAGILRYVPNIRITGSGGSGGGGGGGDGTAPSVPTTGQIWPRGNP